MGDNLVQARHKEREINQLADSIVTQHQSTSQNNISIQAAAVAIAQNGSYIAAIQTTEQKNKNEQSADSNAKNIVKGDQGDFSERNKPSCSKDKDNTSTAAIVENQYVEQANFSKAFRNKQDPCRKRTNFNSQPLKAVAINGENVPMESVQVVRIEDPELKKLIARIKRKVNEEIEPLCQNNSENSAPADKTQNDRPSDSNNTKTMAPMPCYDSECCTDINQRADAISSTIQSGSQRNDSKQTAAIAIAISPGSVAQASQTVTQQNVNSQVISTSASDSLRIPCCDDINQSSTAASVSLSNVNQQNTAQSNVRIAVGLFGGTAEASQSSTQSNDNTSLTDAATSLATECGNQSLLKAVPVKEDKKDNSKKSIGANNKVAEAKVTEMKEKAVIAICKGSVDFKMQIAENGDVYINGIKIELAKLN